MSQFDQVLQLHRVFSARSGQGLTFAYAQNGTTGAGVSRAARFLRIRSDQP